MASNKLKSTWAVLVAACGASLALAHTTVTSTSPATGSQLDESPQVITITFKEAARLTAVVVAQEGKPDRKLTFTPENNATEFKIDTPRLDTGKSTVRWTALSKDGHAIKGAIVLTVKAPAKTT
jgi:copper resistance protein C